MYTIFAIVYNTFNPKSETELTRFIMGGWTFSILISLSLSLLLLLFSKLDETSSSSPLSKYTLLLEEEDDDGEEEEEDNALSAESTYLVFVCVCVCFVQKLARETKRERKPSGT